MRCPTCDEELQAISHAGIASVYHCRRCGTLTYGIDTYVPRLAGERFLQAEAEALGHQQPDEKDRPNVTQTPKA